MVIQSEKISRFSRCALRPMLGAILRDIGCKIAGIPQCRTIGTTLLSEFEWLDPDQDRCCVSLDLGPNCLQWLSSDDKRRCKQAKSQRNDFVKPL